MNLDRSSSELDNIFIEMLQVFLDMQKCMKYYKMSSIMNTQLQIFIQINEYYSFIFPKFQNPMREAKLSLQRIYNIFIKLWNFRDI